jgi:ABC-type multidrug transport system ATPase subunit
VSFVVEPERILRVLGPDGAGKTSLLRIATKAMFLQGGRLTALPAGADGLEDPSVRQLVQPSLSLARNLASPPASVV